MEDESVTREIFRNIPHFWVIVFYLIAFVEILIFFYGFYRLFRKYRKGKSEQISRFDKPLKRIFRPFFGWNSRGQIGERDRTVFIMHSMVLIGMILLFMGTTILTIENDVIRPLFPDYRFYFGTFYIIYSFIMDAAGVAVLVGLLYLGRRRSTRPDRLNYARVDGRQTSKGRVRWEREDQFFAIGLFVIILTGFLLEGIRIVADGFPSFERVSFLGYIFAKIFGPVLSESAAETWYVVLWWSHLMFATVWVAAIPYTKGMHIVTDYFAIATVDSKAANRLPRNSSDAPYAGYNTIQDLSWRDLLSLDACTKCGKCHEACPAMNVGQPLSPRDLILDLRESAASAFGTNEFTNRDQQSNGNQVLVLSENAVVLSETIWSCTTCRACVTHCPVGIEHVPLIIQLRRKMVEEGEIDAGIQSVLEKTGKYGNSFGKSNRMRARWVKKLDFKIKDARKEAVEYLWFVGDFASFDQRAIEDTQKLAEILDYAGVDFGIMYEGEKTAGNDIRRVGEEGLFEMLVEDNLASMSKSKFKKILTTDPHTLNTLRNEYPEFDDTFIENPQQTIYHYTQILWELINDGRITLSKKLEGKVTYHDPCYLGRYVEEYDAPRNVITALGLEIAEMPRCRENSFCCGAGGGMIWMGEEPDTDDRPALNRIREAVPLEVASFVVTCPKDKVMFGDAVKIVDGASEIDVVDIIKLVHDCIDFPEKVVEVVPEADE